MTWWFGGEDDEVGVEPDLDAAFASQTGDPCWVRRKHRQDTLER